MSTPLPMGSDSADRYLRLLEIHRVIRQCFERRSAGESVADETILKEHATLLPELQVELAKSRLVERAWQVVRDADASDQTPSDSVHSSHGDLQVRCPNCRTPTAVVADSSLSSIRCPECQSTFNLLGTESVIQHSAAPRHIGRFELLEQLGVGGFGVVWKARDPELDRLVAIKIPRRGQLSATETDLFFREARTSAQLRHSHIVSVHEVGRDGDLVYIVSDWIDGLSLAEHLEKQRVTVHEAAAFCHSIAKALGHAHAAGIIHRDLKPANVLVDSDGQPHITDFGLASRRGQETTVTLDGQILGTPAYMSPEQARGESHRSDHASDIFSLGVILYELLTGELPFRGSVRVMLEQILSHDPASPRALNGLVPRDLETIVLKCLEKDPRRRYFSARDLSDDLQRYLDGKPIVARPVAHWERAWRWCRRKPAQAAAVGLLLFVATSAPMIAMNQRAMRQTAQQQADAARWQLYLSDMHVAMKAWEQGDSPSAMKILARHLPAAGQPDLRRFEWYYLRRQCAENLEVPTFSHNAPVSTLAVASDGRHLVVGLSNSTTDEDISIWDVQRHVRLHSLRGVNYPQAIAISPDDHWIATAINAIRSPIFDLSSGKRIRELVEPKVDNTLGVTISPDGRFVASGGNDQTVRLWDSETGKLLHSFVDESCRFGAALAFSPGGDTLAAGGTDGGIRLWDVQARTLIGELKGHTGSVESLAFSRDGHLLVTGGADRIIRLWDPTSSVLQGVLVGNPSPIRALALSPDAKSVVSATKNDSNVRVWDLSTSKEIQILKGHSGRVNCLAFSSDGTLYSGGEDGLVKAWNLGGQPAVRMLNGPPGEVVNMAIGNDGRSVITGSGDSVVRVWNLDSGKCQHEYVMSLDGPMIAVSPVGPWIAVGGNTKGRIALWNPATGKTRVLRESGSDITCLAWSHDGATIASGETRENGVVLWDSQTGLQRMRLVGHRHWICSVAFSPDDLVLATRSEDKTLRIWDTVTGDLIKGVDNVSAYFQSPLAYSRDGKLLACADQDNVIQIRGTTDWQVIRTMSGHSGYIKGLNFAPDALTLASASLDGTVRLWEVATGEERAVLLGHEGEAGHVAFTSDGRALVTGGQDGTVRVWQARPSDKAF